MSDEDFAARRMKGRQASDEMQAARESQGRPLDWFEDLYHAANNDPAMIPWADLEPHPALSEWLKTGVIAHKGRAVDVGCGLGDNAEALAAAGFQTDAFDLSPSAVKWAIRRNQPTRVNYCQADLFNLPPQWHHAFDLVNETYTIQALKAEFRQRAFAAIASLVKPGGYLLVICRSRADDVEPSGPPWPLSGKELSAFEANGLEVINHESFDVKESRTIPHFRILYQRS